EASRRNGDNLHKFSIFNAIYVSVKRHSCEQDKESADFPMSAYYPYVNKAHANTTRKCQRAYPVKRHRYEQFKAC
ncbi:MAG: hypothetical protein J6K86_01010, partial [Clostridia bacterium]|nr:hypothetical protein [Clostridia bacterium]